jgi:hypothetical protein
VGAITFKKRMREPLFLSELTLAWRGAPLAGLASSLYTSPGETLVPIDDNLVCDGRFNRANQQLKFRFDARASLGYRTKFYLVLAVPPATVSTIKTGSFTLLSDQLPDELRGALATTPLTLAVASRS